MFENPYADVLRESPTGNFTWVIPSWSSDRRPRLTFQWLAFQGREFSVIFPDEASRAQTASAIARRFAPRSEIALLDQPFGVLDIYKFVRSSDYDGKPREEEYMRVSDVRDRLSKIRSGEFTTIEATITPHQIADLLPADAVVHIEPTSQKAREQFCRIGIDLMGRQEMHLAPDMIPDAVAVEEWSLLFLDGETRIEDHGDVGVALVFRSAEAPGTKWFIDAAAEQIRDMKRDEDLLRGFAERHLSPAPAAAHLGYRP